MVQASEILKIITFLGAAYPRFAAFADVNQAKNTAKVWADMLGDIDINLLFAAVKKYCATNKWPPTIAEIRESVLQIAKPDTETTAADAWGEVMSAVKTYGIYREEEALASLSPKTRKIVEYISWREICISENIDVIRGQFRMMYEQVSSRENQEALLPQGLKNKIEQLSEKLTLKLGTTSSEGTDKNKSK